MRIHKWAGPASAGAAAVIALGLGTATADASSAAPAHVSPMDTCSWQPANNSGAPSGFNGNDEIMRTGPSTACSKLPETGDTIDAVYAHCQHNAAGLTWVYLTDYSVNHAEPGWVLSSQIHSQGGALKQC
jgi:hypothetical protein